MVESPPDDAGDAGLCPGPGGPRVPRSGWAREPWPMSLCVRSLCSAMGEATTVSGPHTQKTNKQKKREAGQISSDEREKSTTKITLPSKDLI